MLSAFAAAGRIGICANTGPAIANVSVAAEKIIIPRFIFMDLRPLN